MNAKREYGFPGCTDAQKSNHRHWCYKNGYQPYDLYRQIADAVIAHRQTTLAQRVAAHIKALKSACKKPEWMSWTNWKSYRQYECRSVGLGLPSITPEEWMSTVGSKKKRKKCIHPAFTEEIRARFIRHNRIQRYRRKAELTPEQYLDWLNLPKWANNKPIRPKKGRAKKERQARGSLVFTRPKEEIIMKILMATKQSRSQS